MGVGTEGAEAIQRRSKTGREVAIRAAADARRAYIESELRGEALGLLQKPIGTGGRFHGRAIKSARDLITRVFQRPDGPQRRVDTAGLIQRPDAEVHGEIHMIGYYVRDRAALDHVRPKGGAFFPSPVV